MTVTLIIDTNLIVTRDWRLTTPWWSVLLGLSATGQINLVVPEVVIRETVGQFSQSISTHVRELAKLGITLEKDREVSTYESTLRRLLVEAGASIPALDPISVLELADRAIKRLRPFNDQGHGFRDTVIWAYVLDAAGRGERIVFLSSDSGFCEGKGKDRRLHVDLARESASVGEVAWFADIGSYLDSTDQDSELSGVGTEVLNLIRNDWAQVQARLTAAARESTAVVYGRDDIVVTVSAVGQPVELGQVRVVRHPQNANAFVVTVGFRAPLEIDVDETLLDYTEIHRGVELSPVSLDVEAVYDVSLGQLDQFIGGRFEVEWDWIVSAIDDSRRPKGQLAHLSLSQSEAIREMMGFDLGQLDAIGQAFKNLDLGQSEAIRKMMGSDLDWSEPRNAEIHDDD